MRWSSLTVHELGADTSACDAKGSKAGPLMLATGLHLVSWPTHCDLAEEAIKAILKQQRVDQHQ